MIYLFHKPLHVWPVAHIDYDCSISGEYWASLRGRMPLSCTGNVSPIDVMMIYFAAITHLTKEQDLT